jgi:hypothetical protein
LRTDLSLGQQIVQASHAALEAGLRDKNSYNQTTSIILFQIPNEEELKKELQYITSLGIPCASFYEPYNDTGITSFATLPITEDKRHLFKKYTLWGRDFKESNPDLHSYLKLEKQKIKQLSFV